VHHIRTSTRTLHRHAHALLFPVFLSRSASSARVTQVVYAPLAMDFVKACGIAGLKAAIERVSITSCSIERCSVCSLRTGMRA
jgi:hypothetical protein